MNVISTLLNLVMKEFKIDHAGLAEIIEVKIQRVRDLASGRVKKLTREESELLVSKLGIRAEWLITGDGPMLQDNEPQDEFVDRVRAINQGQALLNAMPISDATRQKTGALLTGDAAQDGQLIAYALRSEMAPLPPLTARESDLLENYRAAPEDAKKALETTSSYLAKSNLDKGKAA